METITIHNKKGGVGKSTTTQCMAAALRKLGKNVLVIDCDSQRNTSDAYNALGNKRCLTIFDFFSERCDLDEAIQHTGMGDIIISDKHLPAAFGWISDSKDGVLCLKNALDSIRNIYDYVLIDTNMAHDLITECAIIASDKVVIPVDDSTYSMQGIIAVAQKIKELNTKYHLSIEIGGILRIKYRANYQSWKTYDELYSSLASNPDINTKVYHTVIPSGTIVSKAQLAKKSVNDFDSRSTVAVAYKEFAEEFISA